MIKYNIESLPIALLAKILSYLPLDSAKDRLLTVSGQFCRALLVPAAHDEFSYPVRFPVEHEGPRSWLDCGRHVSKLRRLSSTLDVSEDCTEWIQPNNVKYVIINAFNVQIASLAGFPVLPKVRVLHILVDSLAYLSDNASRIFPNVEVLNVQKIDGSYSLEEHSLLQRYISSLPHLRWLEVYGPPINCRLNSACKLVLTIDDIDDWLDGGRVPFSVQDNLIWICIQVSSAPVDLSVFAECPNLNYIELQFEDIPPCCSLSGFDKLPQSVTSVCVAALEPGELPLHWVARRWTARCIDSVSDRVIGSTFLFERI